MGDRLGVDVPKILQLAQDRCGIHNPTSTLCIINDTCVGENMNTLVSHRDWANLLRVIADGIDHLNNSQVGLPWTEQDDDLFIPFSPSAKEHMGEIDGITIQFISDDRHKHTVCTVEYCQKVDTVLDMAKEQS